MNDIPTSALAGALVFLLFLSAFFSGSETALMTLNRYRLRHLADAGHPGARLAEKLLSKPDRLIGLILLGNNFVNILASSLATIIAIRMGGEGAIPIAAGLLTLVVLIFSEVAPKTMAALYPERVAFPASWIFTPLLRVLFPLVWVVNLMANTVLRLLGIYPRRCRRQCAEPRRTAHRGQRGRGHDPQASPEDADQHPRPREGHGRRHHGAAQRARRHRLANPLDVILEQLEQTAYTRVLAYDGSIDNVLGFLHSRRAMQALLDRELTRADLERLIREPYFIPKGTPLNRQLRNFQNNRRRSALVVDEYGDVVGLVTMADVLEEIVGEFATDPADGIADVQPQDDGSFLVDGSANLRELVRTMHWELPTDGPKTLNGLIIERLESLPETGTSLMIGGYPIEVVLTQDNAVKTARIRPNERRQEDD